MEGISHEAVSLAGHLKLGKLILFFDDNAVSIDGATSLSVSDDQSARFRACGWHVQEIDGHDTDQIRDAIAAARETSDRPSMIACRTVIGLGMPTRAGTSKAHSDAPGEEEIKGARERLDWPYPPFEIPPELLQAWRAIGGRGQADHSGLGRPPRCGAGGKAPGPEAPDAGRAAARLARGAARRQGRFRRRQAGRDPRGERAGAGHAGGGDPGAARRLG